MSNGKCNCQSCSWCRETAAVEDWIALATINGDPQCGMVVVKHKDGSIALWDHCKSPGEHDHSKSYSTALDILRSRDLVRAKSASKKFAYWDKRGCRKQEEKAKAEELLTQ